MPYEPYVSTRTAESLTYSRHWGFSFEIYTWNSQSAHILTLDSADVYRPHAVSKFGFLFLLSFNDAMCAGLEEPPIDLPENECFTLYPKGINDVLVRDRSCYYIISSTELEFSHCVCQLSCVVLYLYSSRIGHILTRNYSGRGPDPHDAAHEARAVAVARILPEAARGVVTTIVGATADLVHP